MSPIYRLSICQLQAFVSAMHSVHGKVLHANLLVCRSFTVCFAVQNLCSASSIMTSSISPTQTVANAMESIHFKYQFSISDFLSRKVPSDSSSFSPPGMGPQQLFVRVQHKKMFRFLSHMINIGHEHEEVQAILYLTGGCFKTKFNVACKTYILGQNDQKDLVSGKAMMGDIVFK